jgi:hypothetical protein
MYSEWLHGIFDLIRGTGHSVGMDILPVKFNDESGRKVEGYVRVNFMPIMDEKGDIAGIYQHNVYLTTRIQAERR